MPFHVHARTEGKPLVRFNFDYEFGEADTVSPCILPLLRRELTTPTTGR
jgi:hypothetical protein